MQCYSRSLVLKFYIRVRYSFPLHSVDGVLLPIKLVSTNELQHAKLKIT
jgi:hypothetical protein